MLDRTKRALVESYVGAIALGYLFAQAVLHFVNIFAAPIAGWISRKQYGGLVPGATTAAGLPLEAALPELVRFFLLAVVWIVLIRWLYFTSLERGSSGLTTNVEQSE